MVCPSKISMSNSPLGGLLLISQPKHTTRGGIFNIKSKLPGYQVNLTKNNVMSDTVSATAKSVAGRRNPKITEVTNTPLFVCVFFCGQVSPVMVGLFGQPSGWPSPVCGIPTPSMARHLLERRNSCVAVIPKTQEAIMPTTISRRPIPSNSIPNQIDSILTDLVALSEGIAYLDPKETPDGVLSALAFIQLNKLETLESLIDSLGVRA